MTLDSLAPLQIPISGFVVVVLADYWRQHQGWGWLRLMSGPKAFQGTPGLQFAKVMGSGQNGGFSLRPSASHQGFICCFESWSTAVDFLRSPLMAGVAERARQHWRGIFSVQSARGEWDRQAWTPTSDNAWRSAESLQAHPQMLGVLTRASIRPAKAVAFWRHAPAAQADLEQAKGCELAMGLGEAPLLRQCTFSLWRDTECMTGYAHHQSHQQAIQAAYKHRFFAESLFVRMQLLCMQGQWKSMPHDYQAQCLDEVPHV